MLGRVAHSVYWMNRYIERAENVARFLDVTRNLSLDLPGAKDGLWEPLVTTTGDLEAFRARYGRPTAESVLRFLAFDAQNPNSIVSCLTAARENARSVREVISSEMWEQANRAYLRVRDDIAKGEAARYPQAFLAQVKMDSHLFAGVMEATMSHGEAWHFGNLGRFLERADQTSRLVDVKYFILLPSPRDVGTPLDDLHWSALLKSASALEMYRKQRHRRIRPAEVVDFLLRDRAFPRSVLFCLCTAEQSLHAITGTPEGQFGNEAEKRLGQVRADLSFRETPDIVAKGLHEYLDEFQRGLNAVGDSIFDTFFALRPVPAQGRRGERE